MYLKTDRERLVDQALHKALIKCDEYDIETVKRQRFKKRMAGEQIRDAGLTFQQEIKISMLESIDRFI